MTNIGPQIHQIRKHKRMTLTELARESGVQIATLSRIENGKMTGTLECHFQIAKALGVELAELYKGVQEDAATSILAEEQIEAVSAPDDKISRDILVRQAASRKMLPTLVKIAGRTTSAPEKYTPGSERFVYVIEGTVIVHIKDQNVRLAPHASLYFNASLPHYFDNPLAAPCRLLSVLTPAAL